MTMLALQGSAKLTLFALSAKSLGKNNCRNTWLLPAFGVNAFNLAKCYTVLHGKVISLTLINDQHRIG